MTQVVEHLGRFGVDIELGPVERMGARGYLISVYVRDPDHNLIEIANDLDELYTQQTEE
jgi:catechol 2,3-dioxygenase-like lactoylglutathione lyase family enzyme